MRRELGATPAAAKLPATACLPRQTGTSLPALIDADSCMLTQFSQPAADIRGARRRSPRLRGRQKPERMGVSGTLVAREAGDTFSMSLSASAASIALGSPRRVACDAFLGFLRVPILLWARHAGGQLRCEWCTSRESLSAEQSRLTAVHWDALSQIHPAIRSIADTLRQLSARASRLAHR